MLLMSFLFLLDLKQEEGKGGKGGRRVELRSSPQAPHETLSLSFYLDSPQQIFLSISQLYLRGELSLVLSSFGPGSSQTKTRPDPPESHLSRKPFPFLSL